MAFPSLSREISIDTMGLILPANTQTQRHAAAFRALQLSRRVVTPRGIPNPTLRNDVERVHSAIRHTSSSIDDKLGGKYGASLEFVDPKTGIKWIAEGARSSIPGDPFLIDALKKPAMFELTKERSRSLDKTGLTYTNVMRVDITIMNDAYSIFDLIGINFEELRHFEYSNRSRDSRGRFLGEMFPTLEGLKINHYNDYAALVRTELF